MTQGEKATNGARNGLRAPSGRIVPHVLVIATKAFTLLGVIFAIYVLAFFSAVRIVPMIMGFVKDGTGVQMEMSIDTVLAVWVAPSLFLIALLFAFVFTIIRKLWHLRTALVARVTTWAHGRNAAEADAIPASQRKSGARRTTKRIPKSA